MVFWGEEHDGADSFLLQVCLCGVLCQLKDYFALLAPLNYVLFAGNDPTNVSYTKLSIFVHVVFNITMSEASEYAPKRSFLCCTILVTVKKLYTKIKNNYISTYKSTVQLIALSASCIIGCK